MTDNVISTKLRIITPDDGMALTDGSTYTKGSVYLAHSADASRWREIPEGEVPPQDDRPNPPRTFSKLRIVASLTDAGVWPQVKQYIEQAGLYDLYLAAQDFAEDNEYFAQGKTALQSALGWTDAQVEAVLAQAEIGGAT